MRALLRIAWRQLVRTDRPLSALAVLGVALGVAVVVGIDLTTESALRSFDRSLELLTGRATHSVTAVGGRAGAVPDRTFGDLRVAHGVDRCAPVVEGTVRLQPAADGDGAARRPILRLLGVDPFAEAPLRPTFAAFAAGGGGFDAARLLAVPGAALLSVDTAARLGVGRGDRLAVDAHGHRAELEVIDLLAPGDEHVRRGLDATLVVDVSTAQEVLRRGGLDRIDVALTEAEAARIAAALPPELRLQPTGGNRGTLRRLTASFRDNLGALGLLALLIGGFLSFQTMQFAVLRRREQIAVLRAIGAGRAAVFAALLLESAALGVVGSALGAALGAGLAQLLQAPVMQVVQERYAPTVSLAVEVHPAVVAKGTLLGVLVCLVAGLRPALSAASTSPLHGIARIGAEREARRHLTRDAVLGLATIAGGVGLAWSAGAGAVARTHAGVFAALLGCVLLCKPATALLLRALHPIARAAAGTRGALAVRGADAGLSRTGPAVAALTLAVAATIGLGTMIASFRTTFTAWLADTLTADVFVSAPSTMATRTEAHVAAEAVAALRAVPGTAAVATYRRVRVEDERGREFELAAIAPAPQTASGFRFAAGDRERALAAFARGEGLLVSEPLAARLQLAVGDELALRGDRGALRLPVRGVFRDYASEQGWVAVERRAYRSAFADDAVSSVALWAAPGIEPDAYLQRVRDAAAGGEQALSIVGSRGLRATSLRIFAETFAVTDALRVLLLLVATVGTWSAISALLLERRREFAVLRAVGAGPWQTVRLLLAQAALLGLCAGALAIPIGVLLGWLLVDVVQPRSFGWTLLDFTLPPAVVAEGVGLAVAAAAAACVWPALALRRRMPLAAALREE